MNKQEAAQFLGVSVRTLESYVSQGRLPVRYIRGKTRPVADFSPEDLQAFSILPPTTSADVTNSANPEKTAQNQTSQISQNLETDSEEIAVQTPQNSAITLAPFDQQNAHGGVFIVGAQQMGELLGAVSDQTSQTPQNLAAKFLLTLAEAQTLTGLSRDTLRKAIAAGELPARQIGKAWRLRPEDVRAWLEKQFTAN